MAAAKMFLKFLLFSQKLSSSFLFSSSSTTPLHRKGSARASAIQLRKCHSLRPEKLPHQTLLFDLESALLKSSSLFSYFMLVAFEASGLLRAFLLLALYPLMCLLSEDMAIKLMVMVTFCGVREKDFRVGRSVLPKFFMEDVRLEGFQVLVKAGRRVGVSGMPRVMVEVFMKEYLNVEVVVGREMRLIGGFYSGLMENKVVELDLNLNLSLQVGDKKMLVDVVGMASFNKSMVHQYLFCQCQDIYLVNEANKGSCNSLARENYPKPVIFHDGRLAFRPTPLASLAMFMWVPFGLPLALFRALISLFLPYHISIPLLVFTGMKVRFQGPPTPMAIKEKPKGTLYVSNHRTLLDPLYLSFTLRRSMTAVTYSLSRVSELLSPIKTARLTRDKEEDRKRMEMLLRQGDLVVCPEGTTCREPFLLRFSPLFAELTDMIIPIAMDVHVSMFYGTTASGLKCLDPLFFLMNPSPFYYVELLGEVRKESNSCGVDEKSSISVANMVQKEIGHALRFECTQLTRKDKYLMLAGNEGVVQADIPQEIVGN